MRDHLEARRSVVEVVERPLGAVGQDADVALTERVGERDTDVQGELLLGLFDGRPATKIALGLDDRGADLDVDPPTTARLDFQLDEALGVEVKSAVEEQRLGCPPARSPRP